MFDGVKLYTKSTDELPGVTSFYTEIFDSELDFFGKIEFELAVSSGRDDTAFYLAVNFSDETEHFIH